VSYFTGSPRMSILSVIVLFAAGAYLLTFVPAHGTREAKRLAGA